MIYMQDITYPEDEESSTIHDVDVVDDVDGVDISLPESTNSIQPIHSS